MATFGNGAKTIGIVTIMEHQSMVASGQTKIIAIIVYCAEAHGSIVLRTAAQPPVSGTRPFTIATM
jgi:hypothetical protein